MTHRDADIEITPLQDGLGRPDNGAFGRGYKKVRHISRAVLSGRFLGIAALAVRS